MTPWRPSEKPPKRKEKCLIQYLSAKVRERKPKNSYKSPKSTIAG